MKEIAGLKVYSTREIAELLSLTYPSVLTMIKDGRLPAAKVGHAYAITEDALRKFLNGETTKKPKKQEKQGGESGTAEALPPDVASEV